MIVYGLFVHKKSVSKRKVCIIFKKIINLKKPKKPKKPIFCGFFRWVFYCQLCLERLEELEEAARHTPHYVAAVVVLRQQERQLQHKVLLQSHLNSNLLH
jgi:hypothetical protein